MHRQERLFMICFISSITLLHVNSQTNSDTESKNIFCFYHSWNTERHDSAAFSPKNIESDLCTHIIYTRGDIDSETGIRERDTRTGEVGYKSLEVLKTENKKLKTLLSIGVENEESRRFSRLLSNPKKRVNFIRRIIDFLIRNHFNGLHLDWSPKDINSCSDKENYGVFIKELGEELKNTALQHENEKLLLTISIPPYPDCFGKRFDVQTLSSYADFVIILTHDFHTESELYVTHQAPLYSSGDKELNNQRNVAYAVTQLLGVINGDPKKLIFSIPTYGRIYTLLDADSATIGSQADGPGQRGKYTMENDRWAYFEICNEINNKSFGWNIVNDTASVGMYAHRDRQWITFDDEFTIAIKSKYAAEHGLGGIAFVSVDMDDFGATCSSLKYPLIKAAKSILATYTNRVKPNSAAESTEVISPQSNNVNVIDINLADSNISLFDETKRRFVINLQSKITINAVPFALVKRPVFMRNITPLQYSTGEDQPINNPSKEAATITDASPHTCKTNISKKPDSKKVVCYYPSWAPFYRQSEKLYPENIDADLCTHVMYAFVQPSENNTLISGNPDFDITQGGFLRFTSLKSKNTNLKTLVAVGGSESNGGDRIFSQIAADSARRNEFKKGVSEFLRKYNFDGLDIDWQFPGGKKGSKADKSNFIVLLKELNEEFEKEAKKSCKPKLIISVTLPSSTNLLEQGYDLSSISRYAEFMSALTYNYHKSSSQVVNHHSPLYALPGEKDQTKNANYTINYLIEKGADSKKLIFGIPIYGTTFTLANQQKTKINSPSKGPGRRGTVTNEDGSLSYFEICAKFSSESNWKHEYDDKPGLRPYAFRKDQWIGYENEQSVQHKVAYVNSKDLGGIMFWNLAHDDVQGTCRNSTRYPIILAAKKVLFKKN